MAELRLIALVALAGCGSSEAGPGSGLTPPEGWQALPNLATAARDAATKSGISIDGVEAWGEAARGCYAAWISLRGDGAAPATMADQLVASLSTEPVLAGIVLGDVVKPTAAGDHGVLAFTFERAMYRGKLRATLARDGKIAALACFWNQREPAACEHACTGLVGSMR